MLNPNSDKARLEREAFDRSLARIAPAGRNLMWIPNPQENGRGWITRCENYAIRECIYRDGTPTDYWCYYKVKSTDNKFMHVYDGVHLTLEEAVGQCEQLAERGKK